MINSTGAVTVNVKPRQLGPYWALELPDDTLLGVTLSRAIFEVGKSTGKALVRRLNNGSSALLLDRFDHRFRDFDPEISINVKVCLLADRNKSRVPPDVVAILEKANLPLSDLSEADVRHLVTMVQESKSEVIRICRIKSYVASRCSTGAKHNLNGGRSEK